MKGKCRRGRRRGLPKAVCEMRHSQKRAWERFGMRLSDDDYRELCRAVQGGQARFILAQSRRISLHEVQFGGQRMVAVWDKARSRICSFLRPDQVLGAPDWYEEERGGATHVVGV